MALGPLHKGAKNPSSMLYVRIKKVTAQEAKKALDSTSIGEAVEQFLTANPVPAGPAVGVCLRSPSLRRNAPRLVCNRFKEFSRQSLGF